MRSGWPARLTRSQARAGAARRLAPVWTLVVCLLGVGALALPASAQDRPAADGVLRGIVFDAQTLRPMADVTVMVEPAPGGLLPRGAPLGGMGRGLTARTDEGGRYRFDGLPRGVYTLYVQRFGYAGNVLQVEIGPVGEARLSIGMRSEPIALHPVRVHGGEAQPFLAFRAVGEEARAGRIAAEVRRQETFLQGDIRGMSRGELMEAVTLGETDLFRALQRIPGVSARDDYTAVLWTRGALWDETRVYFDGLPLYNPTHAGWLVSSVNPDGLGGAFFKPGLRSAAIGEGAAGVLDLQSRRGGRDGLVSGTGEVSVASVRAALDGPLPGGGGWMIAGRRSYLDWITLAARSLTDGDVRHLPYDFADLTGRVDVPIARGIRLEASGLWESDRVNGDLPRWLYGNRARWGNQAGRVTVQAEHGGLVSRHTVGTSGFGARIAPQFGDSGAVQIVPTEPTANHRVQHLVARSELSPRTTAPIAPWRVGIEVVGHELEYMGPRYPALPTLAGSGGRAFPDPELARHSPTVAFASSHRQLVGWGERRWELRPGLTLETGMRVEAGDSLANTGAVRLGPRMGIRLRPDAATSLSAGWGRSFQYVQAVGPLGRGFGPELHVSHLWLLAGDEVPAIRSDIGTVGLERWLGETWLAQANGYVRLSAGLAAPDPAPGTLGERPLFVPGSNEAYGVELGLRRLAGRTTASIGYAYGVSQMDAGGFRYPAPADQRHTLDLAAAYHLVPGLRVGAAYAAASGKPFTRFLVGDSITLEEPNAERGPSYASLDLLVDVSASLWSLDVGAYLQLRNALNRANDVTYLGSESPCDAGSERRRPVACEDPTVRVDRFVAGLPRLPVVGVRVAF
jgi:hypothetical protein